MVWRGKEQEESKVLLHSIVTNVITKQSGNKPCRDILNQHEGVYYSCDHCEYTVTHKRQLQRHLIAKHEEPSYQCQECEYRLDSLKYHQESKHYGISFSCDQCQYKATMKSSLKKHVQGVS